MRRSNLATFAKNGLVFALSLAAFGLAGCAADFDEGDDADADDELVSVSDDALGKDYPTLCETLGAKRAQFEDGSLVTIKGKTYHVVQGTEGDDKLLGTSRADLIFGGKGDDRIYGKSGDDIVCAGAGRDVVFGGMGRDRIYGEGDDDVLHGGNGGDWIHGGDGQDEVYGDLLDDELFGDDGADLVVGGHGVDHIRGGAGDDWLRGDTNGDEFDGGAGDDVVSFMTARPTGNASRNSKFVMKIDWSKRVASGDGFDEPLRGIERVVGSAFADQFDGPAGRFSSGHQENLPLPHVFVDARTRDTGIVMLGSPKNDRLVFRYVNGKVRIEAPAGQPIYAGADCAQTAPNVATCTPPNELRYLLAWGDDGDDRLEMKDGFPRDFTAHLDGGEGDDHLIGGDGEDLLFSGRSGKDVLDGGEGDDALISESYADDRTRKNAEYAGGADELYGRSGNDQLVSDHPCGRHLFSGGAGYDIAGFARVGERRIFAQLSGPIAPEHKSKFYGRAYLPDFCGDPLKFGTKLEDDLEILEGSKGDDRLYGNKRDNVIWGRQGNDVLKGCGGDDELLGHEDKDTINGKKE